MNRKISLSLNLICSYLVLTGCAHKEKMGAEVGTRFDQKTYAQVMEKATRHDNQYEGFYNKFELYATFLNTEAQTALLQKKSDVFQWDMKQAQAEREKMQQENTTQTKFALSFFIPSARLNDLSKGNSIWKAYLEAGGQRYEGRITKRNGKLEDLQALFPSHNRWSVPYEITFNVPLSGVETTTPVKLILTSTQGTSTLTY